MFHSCIFVALALLVSSTFGFQSRLHSISNVRRIERVPTTSTIESLTSNSKSSSGASLIVSRSKPLRDILGLGPAEIAVTLVVALVLFGPETLKSLSKDVGKAAAELKEIPKTFKEGMEEGSESAQVSKMKKIAAEKRAKRDAKMAKDEDEDDDEEDDDDEDDDEEEEEEEEEKEVKKKKKVLKKSE